MLLFDPKADVPNAPPLVVPKPASTQQQNLCNEKGTYTQEPHTPAVLSASPSYLLHDHEQITVSVFHLSHAI